MKLGKLPKLLPGVHPAVPAEHAEIEVTGVTHDSRRVKPGWVFVAITGHERDGAQYVEDALARGAAAIVAERAAALSRRVPLFIVTDARRSLAALAGQFFGRPSRRLKVIGVTGTNGKTTTTWMLRSILGAIGQRCGVLGTISYDTGRRNLPAAITTPESVDIQEFFAEMVAEGIQYAAIEVSSHALCMHRVDFVHFAAAIFTNLSSEHMDYHRNITAYRDSKAKLFNSLGPTAWAALNADDEHSAEIAKVTFAQKVTYGIKKNADVTATVRNSTLDGIDMMLRHGSAAIPVHLPLIGVHNVYNALGAAAAALRLGQDLGSIGDGLRNCPPVPGRLEPVPCDRGCKVLVDFAHTDQALHAVLTSLRKLTGRRILVVFGAGGDRDRSKRPRMGRVVQQNADLAWVTSDNPRGEDPMGIINEILSGVKNRRRMNVQPDREAAIKEAIDAAKPGDLVLIAGKGHERTQRFKDMVIPFDDREAVQRALSSAG